MVKIMGKKIFTILRWKFLFFFSTQNIIMLKIMGTKIFTILRWNFCVSKPMVGGAKHEYSWIKGLYLWFQELKRLTMTGVQQQSDLDVFKDIPGYRAILKAVLQESDTNTGK